MGAHVHRTLANCHLYRPGSAGIDVLDRIVPLQTGNRGNRALQPASCIAATAQEARLVEMNMGIDETRQHQPPTDCLILPACSRRDLTNSGNAAIGDAYILQRGASVHACIAQHKIEGFLK